MTIPSPPDPDDDYLARLAQVDAPTVKHFYRQFLPPVRAKLAAAGLGEDECRDLAAEVLYEAAQKIRNYDRRKGRFITWLLTITQRRGVDYVRKRGWLETEKGYVPREISLDGLEDDVRQRYAAKEALNADQSAVESAQTHIPGADETLDSPAVQALDDAVPSLAAELLRDDG